MNEVLNQLLECAVEVKEQVRFLEEMSAKVDLGVILSEDEEEKIEEIRADWFALEDFKEGEGYPTYEDPSSIPHDEFGREVGMGKPSGLEERNKRATV